jgi:uncharacterized phage-like protein YoqJ
MYVVKRGNVVRIVPFLENCEYWKETQMQIYDALHQVGYVTFDFNILEMISTTKHQERKNFISKK